MKKILKALASVKLTLFLFLALVVICVLGTLVPQGLPVEHYREAYGPGMASFIEFFHIYDLYRSWWFTVLLFFFAVNIAACAARWAPGILKRAFSQDKIGDGGVFENAPVKRSFKGFNEVEHDVEQARSLIQSVVGKPKVMSRDGKTYLFAEKGRYARVGVVAVHVSILVILGGGLVGSIWGFSGQMKIVEGSWSNRIELSGGGTRTLPFALACDEFSLSFYENGMPREYRSEVAILENGERVLSATVRVNEPLKYGGLKFCQATYGIAEATGFVIAVADEGDGDENFLVLELMKKVPLPGNEVSVAAARFAPDLQGRGPALMAVLIRPGMPHDIFWIIQGEPISHGGYIFDFKDFEVRFYTGIQVSGDPGVPLVWTGFFMILAGFTVCLSGPHRRVWVRITPSEEGGNILIAADPGRNRKGFEERLDEACRVAFAEGLHG